MAAKALARPTKTECHGFSPSFLMSAGDGTTSMWPSFSMRSLFELMTAMYLCGPTFPQSPFLAYCAAHCDNRVSMTSLGSASSDSC